SIRKAGNKVRITAQLIKAKDGYHQWSNTYDRDLTDIFAVQDEIAGAIVREMSAALPALARALGAMQPVARADIGAYEAFLLARERMTQIGTQAAYEEAVALLDDAIARDPHYAPALAWRSYAAAMLSDVLGSVGDTPMAEALPVIRDYAERAIAEDPESPEAVFALGNYYGQLALSEDMQYLDKAIATLRQAVALRPSFPQAQNDLAFFVGYTGEKAEAIAILEDVLVNDPGLRDANVSYINNLARTGRFEDAEAALGRWARVRPGTPDLEIMRAYLLASQGRLADAWRQTTAIHDTGAVPAGLLATMRHIIRSRLGDGQWLLANAKTPREQAVGALLAGDTRRALELVDSDPLARQTAGEALGSYIPVHYAGGDARAVVAYYATEMGTPASFVAAVQYCQCNAVPLLLALREAGHADFRPLLDAWKGEIEAQREFYSGSFSWRSDRADIAALEGDFGTAKKLYGAAMDAGWRTPDFVARDLRAFLPQDPDFDALLSRMRDLVDTERRSLGMPPL
ncbi:MAG TPA: hypothetical protein VF200_02235, partial [Woeseiaceae bacterium]